MDIADFHAHGYTQMCRPDGATLLRAVSMTYGPRVVEP
nr:hypothetical protein JVH1_0265 [Rhodococcus sp. JVH1]